jgi:hypothetical protein
VPSTSLASGASSDGVPGTRRTLADVKVRNTDRLALGLGVCTFVGWLWVSRSFGFWFDEWDFVLHQPTGAGAYFLPHNEHWSTLPIVVYQVLLGTVGMHSHIPYMAALLLFHVGTAMLLFRIIRRRAGDVLALIGMALLLIFGWGVDDFLWAFQIGFLGPAFFGLIAIDQLDAREWRLARGIGVAAALVVSVASSGIGLAFVIAAAATLLLDRSRRARLWLIGPPLVTYLAWYATVGASRVSPIDALLSVSTFTGLGGFVAYGVGAVGAAIAGVGTGWGDVLCFRL